MNAPDGHIGSILPATVIWIQSYLTLHSIQTYWLWFDITDVIRTDVPNAEYAFLSACHTAEISRSGAHDESLHMQFSGFRSVIGTMWEFYDEDGPLIARVVHEYVNDCDEEEVKEKWAASGLRKAALELKARDGIPTERWVNFVNIGASIV